MADSERKGDKYMVETKEKLDEVGKKMDKLISTLSQKDASVTSEMIMPIYDQMGSVIDSAQKGKQEYKNANKVTNEVIEKRAQPSNEKIPNKLEFSCDKCHFTSPSVDTVEKHEKEYHRPRPSKVRDKYQELNKKVKRQ